MFARIATFKGSVERLDEGVPIFTERILPEKEQQPGFVGSLILHDDEAGLAHSLTFWETEEALDARTERANELAEMVARELDMELKVSKCEVAFSEFPALTS